jgi:tol-pal system protein YbgF
MNLRHGFLLLSALAVGCASGGDLQKVSNQVTDLQDQIAALKRQVSSKEEVQQLNQKVADQTQSVLKSTADLSVKVADIDDKLQNAQGGIEQTNYRVDHLVQQVTQMQRDLDDLKGRAQAAAPPPAPSTGGVAPPAPANPAMDEMTVQSPPAASEDPIQLYQSAYRDFQKGNYDLAIDGFREFVKAFPKSDLADNGSYWIGESLFSQKKYREAIEQFDIVVNEYPNSDKIPGSLLKKGYSYIELGQKAQGVVQLQYVVHEHPRSPEATLARQKLRVLGIETN